ncbi:MAG: preprotein translocase subunit SecA [Anaerococcus sp.]|nr:preprotein translocase subunit SecA [Anaerococcus sp.]
MLASLIGGIFGTKNERELKRMRKIVEQINALEPTISALSDADLSAKTPEFKQRYNNGESLDKLLPEAFAVCREAAKRVMGMRHYDVQLIGGITLHEGKIAEMRTGEGKTLMGTLACYLNALSGEGVHVITVNDYLAQRDAELNRPLFEFLGLSIGTIYSMQEPAEKAAAYLADITYGTNNQFGFDYLRDNMVIYKDDMVQRGLNYAIVDEVDSILIDEARTPLIISGQGDESTDTYTSANQFIQTLEGRILDPNEDAEIDPFDREFKVEDVDFLVDEKRKTSNLTEKGTAKAEKFFDIENLSDPENLELSHYINNALKANTTMHRDIDYVVNNGEVEIVDEFTGRIMQGRRFSDGLHQAIEAKEGVEVKAESKTLATITFQNYFRMYDKLSGMTGTAKTEEEEFDEIYNLDVVEIPTNKPIQRVDDVDYVYINENGKFNAIIDEINRIHPTGQPILIGTISIEASERLSQALKKAGIKHTVLNAKNHEREAAIVAEAGRFGAVTIATNMAGRGTDIMLGGNVDDMAKQKLKREGMSEELLEEVDSYADTSDQEILDARKKFRHYKDQIRPTVKEEAEKVKEVGGLYIIGSERHESRRIDNQLRGRSGRQGDPGHSRFFISLEDDLIRLNGGEQVAKFVENSNFDENEPIVSKMVSRSVEKAQTRVEANNFATRKRVLQYDDVMNKQRTIIYNERADVLYGQDMKETIVSMIKDVIADSVYNFTNPEIKPENWEMVALLNHLNSLGIPVTQLHFENINDYTQQELIDYITQATLAKYEDKEAKFGPENMREVERVIMLRVIDQKWMDHIDAMDQMRKEIGVRAMGNEDPVRAYTNDGFTMYEEMTRAIQEETVRYMMNVEIKQNIQRKQVMNPTGEAGPQLDGDSENESDDEDPMQGLNRAERRRLEREIKKSNVKK